MFEEGSAINNSMGAVASGTHRTVLREAMSGAMNGLAWQKSEGLQGMVRVM